MAAGRIRLALGTHQPLAVLEAEEVVQAEGQRLVVLEILLQLHLRKEMAGVTVKLLLLCRQEVGEALLDLELMDRQMEVMEVLAPHHQLLAHL